MKFKNILRYISATAPVCVHLSSGTDTKEELKSSIPYNGDAMDEFYYPKRWDGGWVEVGMVVGWKLGWWLGRGRMEVGWRLDGGRMEVGWRLDGGWVKVGWRLGEGWMEVV